MMKDNTVIDLITELTHLGNVVKNNSFKTFPLEMSVLMCLKENNEGLNPSTICDKLGISRPLMTSVINGLEKREYINRIIDTNDKRMFKLFISKKGTKYIEKEKKIKYEKIKALVNKLGIDDTKELIRIIKKCSTIMKGDNKQC